MYLVVSNSFDVFRRGDVISDATIIADILASEWADEVIQVLEAGDIPAPPADFITGYLSLGSGTTSFVEMVGSGYSRKSVSFSNLVNGKTHNNASATFTATGTWPTARQIGVHDADGNLLFWWTTGTLTTLTSGGSLVIRASDIQLYFPDLYHPPFSAAVVFTVGSVIGTTSDARQIKSGSVLQATGLGMSLSTIGGSGGLLNAVDGTSIINNNGTISTSGSFNSLTTSGTLSATGGGALSGTFAGDHTYSGTLTLNKAGTALSISNNATIGGALTLTATGGSNALVFNDSVGTGPRFNMSGNTLRLTTQTVSSGGTVVWQVPSQVASAAQAYVQTTGLITGPLKYGASSTFVAGSALGAPGSVNQSIMSCSINLSGTLDTGGNDPIFRVVNDAVANSSSTSWLERQTYNLNSGFNGNRNGFALTLNKNAASVTPSAQANGYWIGLVNYWMHINVGEGGTASDPLGQYTMLNPDLLVDTGDWVSSAICEEMDLRVTAGTKTPFKVMQVYHYAISDASHASPKTGDPTEAFSDATVVMDAAPTIGNGTGKGVNMFQFGNPGQDTPWDSATGLNTSLMSVKLNCSGNLSSYQQVYVDDGFKLPEILFRNNFIDNGRFRVSGTGDVTAGQARIATTSTGASVDASGYEAVSATVASGGRYARVGSEIVDSQGGIWEVATTNGGTLAGAAVTGVTLKRAAVVSSPPVNPVTCRMGGSDTYVTLNITWTSKRDVLTLQPSGGKIAINSATGPTLQAGLGAPAVAQPSGSIWIRTDGSNGSRIYVSAGSGVWNAIAGV